MDDEKGEIDNCPICNTTAVMRHGLEKGAFEEGEEEVPFVCLPIKRLLSRKLDWLLGYLFFYIWYFVVYGTVHGY